MRQTLSTIAVAAAAAKRSCTWRIALRNAVPQISRTYGSMTIASRTVSR
jgi:hypothetical protein